MPSCYLTGNDLDTYGVPTASPALVTRASLIIDSHLQRPDGLVWVPDATGNPGWMAARDPSLTLISSNSISPGQAVTVDISSYIPAGGTSTLPITLFQPQDTILGEAVVLDRNTANAETCWVQSYSQGQLVLNTVLLSHTTPFTIDLGMTIMEEHLLPNQRSITQLGQWPLTRVISGVGRYGYGRRSEQMQGYFDDVNLLSMFASFGGPPAWETFEIQASSMNPRDGTIWIPAGVLLSYFTEVKMRYLGGWQQAALPSPIKEACAMLCQAIMDQGMGPNVRRFNTGKTDLQKFAATVLDEDVKRLIRPYRATTLG